MRQDDLAQRGQPEAVSAMAAEDVDVMLELPELDGLALRPGLAVELIVRCSPGKQGIGPASPRPAAQPKALTRSATPPALPPAHAGP